MVVQRSKHKLVQQGMHSYFEVQTDLCDCRLHDLQVIPSHKLTIGKSLYGGHELVVLGLRSPVLATHAHKCPQVAMSPQASCFFIAILLFGELCRGRLAWPQHVLRHSCSDQAARGGADWPRSKLVKQGLVHVVLHKIVMC